MNSPASLTAPSFAGFGGYLCYVAVDERFRKQGVATVLYDAFYAAMRADAKAAGEPLPFVLWESYRPNPDDGPAAMKLWQARVRLFERVGGLLAGGARSACAELPEPDAPPVPLQVFLRPMDEPAAAFDAVRFKQIIGDLYDRVLTAQPGDPLTTPRWGRAVIRDWFQRRTRRWNQR